MKLTLTLCEIRDWRDGDEDALVKHASNRRIWLNLRDVFPHPYTLEDARRFLEMTASQSPRTYFCIARDGEAIGSIGFSLHTDVERHNSEIGYWLGEQYWGWGIMTEALRAVTEYAVKTHNLNRVYALPFEWNDASFRVLEKAGYVLEGRLRCSAVKDGEVLDQLLYAYTVEGCRGRKHTSFKE